MRRNRRLIFQQNARQYLQSAVHLNQRESADALQQSAWQLRGLLETRLTFEQARALQTDELQTFSTEKRFFQKGQWVDAKDTIDQWVRYLPSKNFSWRRR